MGYTHYWSSLYCKNLKSDYLKALVEIKPILEKYKHLIQFEYHDNSPYVANETLIHFNGIENDGHETFMFEADKPNRDFCKTAEKPYDYVVCCCLLLLKKHIEGFTFSSDGDPSRIEWIGPMEEVDYFIDHWR